MKFYKNKLPNKDDIVQCKVINILKDLIYVELLEYNNLNGIIQLSNASAKRRNRYKCLLKENKCYSLLVLSIDIEKEFVDLSNKYLSEEDKENFLNKYNLQCKVINIFEKFIKKINTEDKLLYAEKTIWQIEKYECYEYLYNTYKKINNLEEFNITEDEKNILLNILNNTFGEIKISSILNFSLINCNLSSIENIIEIFNLLKDKYEVIVKINSPPLYYVKILNNVKEEEKLNEVNDFLQKISNEKNLIYSKKNIIFE